MYGLLHQDINIDLKHIFEFKYWQFFVPALWIDRFLSLAFTAEED